MNYKQKKTKILTASLTACFFLPISYDHLAQNQQEYVKNNTTSTEELVSLNLIKIVEKQIKGGDKHKYLITAQKDYFLQLVAEQKGIDITLKLLSPSGMVKFVSNTQQWKEDKETILNIFDDNGDYIVEVEASDKNAVLGTYELKIEQFRTTTPKDKDLFEAQILLNKATKLIDASSNLQEALQLTQRALELRESILGNNHPEIGNVYHQIGVICRRNSSYDDAIKYLQKALEIRTTVLKADHPDTASTLHSLANTYLDKGNYKNAESSYKEALAIREKIFGTDSVLTADSYNGLGLTYKNQGNYKESEIYFDKALKIFRSKLDPKNSRITLTEQNLASLYLIQGEYDKALAIYEETLKILKTVPNSELITATTLNSLANIYKDKGDYDKAEKLYKEALEIRSKNSPQSEDVAGTFGSLGKLYQIVGDYDKAENSYKTSLEILEKKLNKQHPSVIIITNNLASLAIIKGDYDKAEKILTEIREYLKITDPNNKNIADVTQNLGVIYQKKKDYDKAENYFNQALLIKRTIFKKDNISISNTLHNLGFINHLKGNFDKSKAFYEEALTIRVKELGLNSLAIAETYNNLAFLYKYKTEYKLAEEYYLKALNIYENKIGLENQNAALILNNLSNLYQAKEEVDKAIVYRNKANEARERELERNLLTGSEDQKLNYLKLTQSEKDDTISLHLNLAPNNEQAAKLALTTILRRKGRGLDAMANALTSIKKRANDQDQALLKKYVSKQSEYSNFLVRGIGIEGREKYQAKEKKLLEEIEDLQSQLSSKVIGFSAIIKKTNLENVQMAIPSKSLLVEFSTYQPYNAKTGTYETPHYVVYLLDNKGTVNHVDLGSVEVINKAVEEFRHILTRQPITPSSDAETELIPKARAIDKLVMERVRQLAPNTRHFIISPDAQLNTIPFEAFVDEQNKYLIENHQISYLTSGRDLIRLQDKIESKEPPIIIADPNYGNGRGPKLGETLYGYLTPLRATNKEAYEIKNHLPQAKIYSKDSASKKILLEVSQPEVLHIATHGYFLENTLPTTIKKNDIESFSLEESLPNSAYKELKNINPLLGVGLFFAGANDGETGVITGLELSSLNLSGTKMVVLSACSSGLGDIKKDEGVYSLKRALVLAGAETQVLSLWSVESVVTKQLMIKYYEFLEKGQERIEAMRNAQLSLLKAEDTNETKLKKVANKKATPYAHPYYWSSFVLSGEWRALK